MDPVSFDRLEFPAVLEIIAAEAVSPAARQELREAKPWTDPETLAHHADAVDEVLGRLDSGDDLPLGGFDDCGAILSKLRPTHGFLEAAEWQALRGLIRVAAEMRTALRAARERMPICWRIFSGLESLDPLAETINRIFDAEGLVRSSASTALRTIRNRMAHLERELERVFSHLLSRFQGDDILRDNYITQRNGRRVLPVRSNARSRLPGIVHDSSNTGETIFVEPMDAVEPANRLAEEQTREREEIFRILSDLAREAREHIPTLDATRSALIQIDLWRARARLAHRHGLHRPRVEPGLALRLMKAHHPLLYFRNPQASVPLNLKLEPDNRALVITGPNTGGKTTSLKTVGLLVLMAQCAVPVPAGVDSHLPLVDQLLVEMGDEQSVSAGLSTFSAHIRRISWILEHCGPNALVLLDELGKATDPAQAGALGQAVLESLATRGALTLVTTHLAALKDWAHHHPDGRNASFRLDPQSHRPQFEIHLDVPGISEAFTIARAEGLPAAVVDRAVEVLPEEDRKMGEVLQTLYEREDALSREIARTEAARKKTEAEARRLAKAQADLDLQRTENNKRLEKEYKALLDAARQDIEKRIANLPSRQAISQMRAQLAADQEAAKRRLEAFEAREKKILESVGAGKQADPQQPYEPAVGDWVRVDRSDQIGRIEQIDDARQRAKILVGSLTLDVAVKKLEPATAPPEYLQAEQAGSFPRYAAGGITRSVPAEIDLHGWRVEEAIDRVDKYLDDAALAHHQAVRVVHGHGTGALRGALHDFFRHHPHVRQFRLANLREGGPAVTIVTLR